MKAKKKQVKKKPSDWKGKRVKIYQSGVNGEVEDLDNFTKEDLLKTMIRQNIANILAEDKRFNVFDVAIALNDLSNEHSAYMLEAETYYK